MWETLAYVISGLFADAFVYLRDKQKYFFCFDRKELNEKKKSNY